MKKKSINGFILYYLGIIILFTSISNVYSHEEANLCFYAKLGLDPSTINSFNTEGVADSAKLYFDHKNCNSSYNIVGGYILERIDVDLSVDNIYSSINLWCGDTAITFQVNVTNNSEIDSYNVPLYIEYNYENGIEYKHLMIIDTLFGNSNKWINLDTTYDMSVEGNYYITAYTEALYENIISNDSFKAQYIVYVDCFDPIINDSEAVGRNHIFNNNDDEFIVKIFPNPNKGEFSLELTKDIEMFEMEIINCQGKLIRKDKIIGNNSDIILSEIVSGLYYIRIMTCDSVYSKAFIIY